MTIAQPTSLLKLPLPRLPDSDPEVLEHVGNYMRPAYDSIVMLAAWAHSAPFFNVKDYGATGDGVTDDRAAIILAYQAAQAAGGGVIFFPAGTYIISSRFPTITTAVGIIFMGAGMGATILKSTVAAGDVPFGDCHFFYFIVNTAPVAITQMTLDINNILTTASNTAAVNTAYCPDVLYHKVEIRNGQRLGFNFAGCDNVTIDNCKILRTYPRYPDMNISAVAASGTGNFRVTVDTVANVFNKDLVLVYGVNGVPTLFGTYQVLNKNSGTNQLDLRIEDIANITNVFSSTGAPGGTVRITVADPASTVQNALNTAEGLTTGVAVSYVYSVAALGDSGLQRSFTFVSAIPAVSCTIEITGAIWGLFDSYGGGGSLRFSRLSTYVAGYIGGGKVRLANSYQSQAINTFIGGGVIPMNYKITNNYMYGWGLLLDGQNFIIDNNTIQEVDYGSCVAVHDNPSVYRFKITNNSFIGTWGEDINITVVTGVECWAPQSIIKGNFCFAIAGGGLGFGGNYSNVSDNIVQDCGQYRASDGITLFGKLNAGQYSTVSNNIVYNSTVSGLARGYNESQAANPYKLSIRGNKIFNYTIAKYGYSVLGAEWDFSGDSDQGSLFVVGGVLAPGASFQFNIFVAGARLNMFVEVGTSSGGVGETLTGRVIGFQQVQITVWNPTAAPVGVFNGTYYAKVSENRLV